VFSKKTNLATITQRLALVCAMLLLSAQTLALAHAHEPMAEPACAICTVSGDDVPLSGSLTSSEHRVPAVTAFSQAIQHVAHTPHQPSQPRAPPLL